MMLCCLISTTSGTARIADCDVGNRADTPKIRKLIGFVPDNVGLCDHMSAYDNPRAFDNLSGDMSKIKAALIKRNLV